MYKRGVEEVEARASTGGAGASPAADEGWCLQENSRLGVCIQAATDAEQLQGNKRELGSARVVVVGHKPWFYKIFALYRDPGECGGM